MSTIQTIVKAIGSLVVIGLGVWPILTADNAAAQVLPAATVPSAFKAEVKTVGGPGQISATYACVSRNGYRFAFRILSGLRMDLTAPDRVALVNTDCSQAYIFRVQDTLPSNGTELTHDTCRDTLFSQHPDAKILEEFSQPAMGQLCPAFDFTWKGNKGVVRRGRAVFLVTSAGVVEFSLLSDPALFESVRKDLNILLQSVRVSDANGKLQFPVIFDKS